MTPIRLEVQDISKRFGVTTALDGVSFTLKAGERLAVLGENGAGKSTLIKAIAGVHAPDVGSFRLNGADYAPKSPAEALASGVSIVYQEPSFFPRLSVLENLFVGRELSNSLGVLSWRQVRNRAEQLFERLGFSIDLLDREMGELRLAEQQLVLIARAVDVEAKVLILDEPTSILTNSEALRLFEVVRTLADQGVSVLYITHRFDELPQVADRLIVLRDGRFVGELPVSAHHDEIVTLMMGRAIDSSVERSPADPGDEVLSVHGYSVSDVVRDVDLHVRKGETVGLYGLVGAGRSELAMGLLGQLPSSGGTVQLNGAAFTPKSPAHAIANGIAYLPEDRKTQGIFPFMSVATNLSASILPRLTTLFDLVRRKGERELVRGWIDRLRIKAARPSAPITSLSGGHQQKVLLARQLSVEPTLLILDEPTRGIDVATKVDVQRMIIDLARGGMGVLVISSELPELLAVSDRIQVMREGRVVAHLTGDDMTEERVLRAAVGVAS
ncbi:sugar ABC transporter ATP-binding protein [Agromyces aerolatus]|uniref:sugar ABC transporter ATP-binding protein n=1 Tax=Agromyces sp. LY-1074 TaxID=3074080 RepID=UPI002860B071|nr:MULTISPECIES: sugar ABC transporter ATP-binding protein [unclassified Agromyces]MDR5700877.1 sugar ABC transporter ATP-binding protein [Agromyces sp. LY-1074]MDR5707462.1 sugar ABC transporter ATP-binding protein [Agromyces sp. LY-1358]